MADFAFETVDVFTDTRFGGNPLAVFPEADGLETAQMQALAREFNLSETTFVFPPRDPAHTAHVRIFTPVVELDFAGHPNVGTALVLARRMPARPDTMAFEERAGLVEIRFDWSLPARATLKAPRALTRGSDIPAETIAVCAGIDVAAVLTARHPPCIAGVGTDFVIAEVTSDALARAHPDIAAMRDAAARFPVRPIGFPLHLYVRDGETLRTRMFSPLSGMIEDPATGSANAALAALMLSVDGGTALRLLIRQGDEMGRPSLLHAEARRSGREITAWIGGGAVPVMRGHVTL